MSLLHPERLFLLVVPTLLVAFALLSLSRRSKAAVRFAHVDLLDEIAPRHTWRRSVPAGLAIAALICCVIGLAHPQQRVVVQRQTRQVVLAFDVSNSMAATDVAPSRLEVARKAAAKFISAAPSDVEVGLVQFAGAVVAVQPPTKDRAKVLAALNSATLHPGTAIGDAIVTSLGMLNSSAVAKSDNPGTIVVLSDGMSTQGTPDAAAVDKAKQSNVAVSTIAFGTANGTVVIDGDTIPVPFAPASLSAISDATGGTATEAGNAGQLEAIFSDLSATVAPETEQRDLADVSVAAGFVLLALGAVLSLRWFARLA